ncbi:serine hydrolase-like protein [Danaus plexippus]|uniref:serine hydrolase-like protein n=1 Tax=Danaus plexippus TaxID=13037 RepID=UPI002AAF3B48|nr:serine hydrolase-like protein [Danaus plexippus]
MNVINEWFIDVPWGKVALISWGDTRGKPVLLVHGRQDSVATFIPLLERLPKDYHYVGFDMPGHGRSDSLPFGVLLTRLFPVCVIEVVLKHLGWEEFYYIGHSMGTEQGLFYNAVFPGQIKKFVLLDPTPALQRLIIEDFSEFYELYDKYYSSYDSLKEDKLYSKESAVEAVMKARGMTREQADMILSRNLIKVGDNLYKLSWDRRTKLMASTYFPKEYYKKLFCKNSPPTLYITSKEYLNYGPKRRIIIEEYLSECQKRDKLTHLRVDGNHDVHFINPERLSGHIISFLTSDVKSKL